AAFEMLNDLVLAGGYEKAGGDDGAGYQGCICPKSEAKHRDRNDRIAKQFVDLRRARDVVKPRSGFEGRRRRGRFDMHQLHEKTCEVGDVDPFLPDPFPLSSGMISSRLPIAWAVPSLMTIILSALCSNAGRCVIATTVIFFFFARLSALASAISPGPSRFE